MVVHGSASAFPETVSRLLEAISTRGLTLFARVDHAAGARDAGMQLAPEQMFLFGDPRAGTPLMQSDPRIGYELPLRILLWEENGRVFIGYRDPRELADLYDVAHNRATLDAMAALLGAISAEAAGSDQK